MVMQLDDDSSMDEIMRAALAGDPKMLRVPKKGLMSPERKNTSRLLRQIATRLVDVKPYREDIAEATHFKNLADKNISGLLTMKEAEEIVENLEAHNPVIVDIGTERWVETNGGRG